VLLLLSWLMILFPHGPWEGRTKDRWPGVPVKDTILQANEFAVCAFLIAPTAFWAFRRQQFAHAAAIILLAVLFVANSLIVTGNRTTLFVLPALLLLFVFKYFSRRKPVLIVSMTAVGAALAIFMIPAVHNNVRTVIKEVREFQPSAERTRAGERLEFWRKSIGFIEQAPLIGHGTGSPRELSRRAAEGQSGMAALVSANPHNQTLAIAIQLGVVGVAMLWVFWVAHLATFWRDGFTAWAGLVIVTQNIVSSLFNSHLADFTQGWGYVIGVGVAAGMLIKQGQNSAADADGRPRSDA
jgi:O-antigen ligase